MALGLPAGEIAMLGGTLIAGGLLTGFLSGLLGVGGGGIIVPILFELFGVLGVPEDIRLHLAVGTSFGVMLPTSVRAANLHYQRGSMDGGLLSLLGPAAIVGVIIGSLMAKYSDDGVMKIVWVFSATLLALSLILRRENWHLKGDIGRPAVAVPFGTFVGFLSTIMGVGGGAQVTALMTLFGRTIHQSVGTAAGFGAFVSLPALFGYIWAGWGAEGLPPGSLGFVSLIGAAAMMPASLFAAPFGVRAAHGLPRRRLEIAFAIFLGLVGLRFLMSLMLS
jgi:uncharacterized membrane protein YfcA